MITEFIIERKRNYYLDFYAQDKKKFLQIRLFFGVLFLLVALLMTWYFQVQFYYIWSLVAGVFGYKYPYMKIIMDKKKMDERNAMLFPEFLQCFISLLPTNNNVYQTLVDAIPSVQSPLREKLEKLVDNIEKYGDKREFYLEVAEYVNTSEATIIMDSLYQFSEQGIQKKALIEIQEYVLDMIENKTNAIIRKKINNLDNIGSFPLIVGLVFFLYFTSIVFLHYYQDVLKAMNSI